MGRSRGWGVLGLLAAGGCASLPANPPAPAQAAVVQVLHRNARDAAGRVQDAARGDLADRAVGALAGTELPLDGWDWVAPEGRVAVIVAVPAVSPLASKVADRLALVSKLPPRLASWKPGDPPLVLARKEVPAVLVFQPSATLPAPDLATILDRLFGAPRALDPLLLVDLIEVQLPEGPWAADEVLASLDPQAAACAARFVLGTRQQGRPPAAADLGPACAAWLERGQWKRTAVTR